MIEYRQYEIAGKRAFVRAVFKPPFRLLAEMFDEACFYYIRSGYSKINSPLETITIKANEGVVLQCGNYINEYLKSSEETRTEVIAIHFFPEVLERIYENQLPSFLVEGETTIRRYEHIPISDLILSYINSLEYYFDHPDLVNEELLMVKLKELLILLDKTDNANIIRSLLKRVYDPKDVDFREVIKNHLYTGLSLEEMAALTNRSLSSFKREFRKHYQQPPAAYIRSKRLERAAHLLKGTDMRVTEVMFECGFMDLAHFSKAFNKHFGKSPSDWR